MNTIKYLTACLAVSALVAGAYFFGKNAGNEPDQKILTGEPRNLQEIKQLESNFDQQQSELNNRVADIQNKIETVKLNLELDSEGTGSQSSDIADRLAELNAEQLQAHSRPVADGVPLPPDSPDGKIINRPRSESGISLDVLRSYEQETGVTSEEIEELMRRTE